jgi:threonine/homoserine/homoserine lactone efflux protein
MNIAAVLGKRTLGSQRPPRPNRAVSLPITIASASGVGAFGVVAEIGATLFNASIGVAWIGLRVFGAGFLLWLGWKFCARGVGQLTGAYNHVLGSESVLA